MGLCTEFGTQIYAGCDEPMIAGSASCSCPSCHVVCTGRFQGCAIVWAQGQQPVTRALPPDPPTAAAVVGSVATRRVDNGSPVPVDSAAEFPSRDVDFSAIATLRTELSILVDRVELASSTLSPGVVSDEDGVAVSQILKDLKKLPERISVALTEVLAHQHSLMMAEIRYTIRSVLNEQRADGS